jgi:hypothetical protein
VGRGRSRRRFVIASEAKQSSFLACAAKLDCFVASLLAMTEKGAECSAITRCGAGGNAVLTPQQRLSHDRLWRRDVLMQSALAQGIALLQGTVEK